MTPGKIKTKIKTQWMRWIEGNRSDLIMFVFINSAGHIIPPGFLPTEVTPHTITARKPPWSSTGFAARVIFYPSSPSTGVAKSYTDFKHVSRSANYAPDFPTPIAPQLIFDAIIALHYKIPIDVIVDTYGRGTAVAYPNLTERQLATFTEKYQEFGDNQVKGITQEPQSQLWKRMLQLSIENPKVKEMRQDLAKMGAVFYFFDIIDRIRPCVEYQAPITPRHFDKTKDYFPHDWATHKPPMAEVKTSPFVIKNQKDLEVLFPSHTFDIIYSRKRARGSSEFKWDCIAWHRETGKTIPFTTRGKDKAEAAYKMWHRIRAEQLEHPLVEYVPQNLYPLFVEFCRYPTFGTFWKAAMENNLTVFPKENQAGKIQVLLNTIADAMGQKTALDPQSYFKAIRPLCRRDISKIKKGG